MDKSKSSGGKPRGRIILLGNGTEVLTDSEDTEMFDRSEEDRDLASQVSKGQPAESTSKQTTTDSNPKYKGIADTADAKVDKPSK